MKRVRVFLSISVAIAICILVAGFNFAAYGQTEPTNTTLSKRLIADYGYWSRTQTPPYSSDQIPFKMLTHINHAGVSFDASGNLIVPSGFLEKALLTKGHSHGVKVMLLLGGDFTGVESTAGALTTLLNNLKTFITENGYDGIDIDWEYPASSADASFFHSLMVGLRTILPSPYLISADVAPWGGTGYDFPDTKFIVDYFNVMTYDCAGPWTDSAQLNSAIFPDPNDPEPYNCEPGGSVKEAIDIYTQQLAIAPSQLNIGTPFYGYVYHQANSLWGYCPDQNKNQECGGSVDYENYGTFFKQRINAMGWRTYYDPYSLVPYMLKADGSDGFITYDDASSTFYRVWYTDWARGLGGTFIWELDADYDGTTQDLLDAAYNASLPQTK